MAGQLGTTADAVGAAVVSATASSRFVAPSYWRDPRSGVSYQVQVQVPQPKMTSLGDVANIPVGSSTGAQPLVSQLADLRATTVPGELDRQNGLWMLALSANLGGRDLRSANKAIAKAVDDAGKPPRGVTTQVRGQVNALHADFRRTGHRAGSGDRRDPSAADGELSIAEAGADRGFDGAGGAGRIGADAADHRNDTEP